MKKLILVALIFVSFRSATNAQQVNPEITSADYTMQKAHTFSPDKVSVMFTNTLGHNGPDKDYDYYMRKKKNNLTAGLVTLGAGVVLSGIGLITASNSTSIDTDATAAVLLIAGAASGIASIPLMIMANVYGHKAKLELRNQKTGFGVPPNVSRDITGITLRIPLGK